MPPEEADATLPVTPADFELPELPVDSDFKQEPPPFHFPPPPKQFRFPRSSLGDEPTASPPKAHPSLPVSLPVILPRRETILAVTRHKIAAQVGMLAIQTLPLLGRVIHSILVTLADATGGYQKQETPFEKDWIEHVELTGQAGEVKPVYLMSQIPFRVETISADDNASVRGRGTRLVGWTVGAEPQIAPFLEFGIWTEVLRNRPFRAFLHTPGLKMTFMIRFLESCTWECDLFGKALPSTDPFDLAA